jgi:hypothetical protein
MNQYLEKEEAKNMYFYNEMIKRKESLLSKFKFISEDYDVREKFCKMIIYAESENVEYADKFIKHFKLDEIDRITILEDLESFIELCIKEKENNYSEGKYND